MTYPSSFIIIGVKGLLHSDWLGAGPAASPIGASWERERWENLATPSPALQILCTGGEYYAPSSEGSISYLFCVQGGKVMCGR
jgi:hypothetical protein